MPIFFKKLPLFIKLVFLFSLLLTGFYGIKLGNSFFENQVYFRLKKIKIYGLVHGNSSKIIEKVGLSQDSNLLSINQTKLKKAFLAIDRIEKVNIKVNWPDTIVIRIEEKIPSFLIKTKRELGAFTEEGILVAKDRDINYYNNFIIVSSAPNLEYAKETKMVKDFFSFYEQLEVVEKNIKNYFSDIVLGDNIVLHDKRKQLTIDLGGELTLEKLRRVYYAYLYYQEKKLTANHIDLTGKLTKFSLINKL